MLRRLLLVGMLVAAAPACTDSGSSGSGSTTTTQPERGAIELVVVRPSESDRWGLEAFTASGRSFSLQTPDEGDPTEPDISADGSKVIYIASGEDYDGPLWITDLGNEDAAPRRVPVDGSWVCPRWFPDGDRVVAMDTSTSRPAIIDVTSGEETPVELPDGAEESSCADPSPDGLRLALAVKGDSSEYTGDTWSIGVESDDAELLGSLPDGCITNFTAWAPSGDSVAVDSVCEPQEHNGIWLVSMNGAAPRKVVGENEPGLELGEGLQYWAPSWTAEDAVVFHRIPGSAAGPSQIWSADVSGQTAPVVESEALFPTAPTP